MINAFSSRNLLFSPTISLCLLTLLHWAMTGIRVLIPFDGTLYHYTSFHVVIDKKYSQLPPCLILIPTGKVFRRGETGASPAPRFIQGWDGWSRIDSRHIYTFHSDVQKSSKVVVHRYKFRHTLLCAAIRGGILGSNTQGFVSDFSHELRPGHFTYV